MEYCCLAGGKAVACVDKDCKKTFADAKAMAQHAKTKHKIDVPH